jgi:hypothetical protein
LLFRAFCSRLWRCTILPRDSPPASLSEPPDPEPEPELASSAMLQEDEENAERMH